MLQLPDFQSIDQISGFLENALERAQGNNLRLLLINCFGETEGEASFQKYADKVLIPLWEMADYAKTLGSEAMGAISAVDHTKLRDQLRGKDPQYIEKLFSKPHMEAIRTAIWDFMMTLDLLHNELEDEEKYPQIRRDMEVNVVAMNDVHAAFADAMCQLDMAKNHDQPIGQLADTYAKLHAQANRSARRK